MNIEALQVSGQQEDGRAWESTALGSEAPLSSTQADAGGTSSTVERQALSAAATMGAFQPIGPGDDSIPGCRSQEAFEGECTGRSARSSKFSHLQKAPRELPVFSIWRKVTGTHHEAHTSTCSASMQAHVALTQGMHKRKCWSRKQRSFVENSTTERAPGGRDRRKQTR